MTNQALSIEQGLTLRTPNTMTLWLRSTDLGFTLVRELTSTYGPADWGACTVAPPDCAWDRLDFKIFCISAQLSLRSCESYLISLWILLNCTDWSTRGNSLGLEDVDTITAVGRVLPWERPNQSYRVLYRQLGSLATHMKKFEIISHN